MKPFCIVMGKKPRAAGKVGDTLLLIAEDEDGKLVDACMAKIDGKALKGGTVYTIDEIREIKNGGHNDDEVAGTD